MVRICDICGVSSKTNSDADIIEFTLSTENKISFDICFNCRKKINDGYNDLKNKHSQEIKDYMLQFKKE